MNYISRKLNKSFFHFASSRTVTAGTGRLEPVPIEVKTGRGGLGREVFQKRRNEERLVMRRDRIQKRARHEERYRQDFRKRFSEKMGDRQVEQDLLKSQKVCGELDAQKVFVMVSVLRSF